MARSSGGSALFPILTPPSRASNAHFKPMVLKQAKATAAYLDAHQFGRTLGEQFVLRPFHYSMRFHEWRNHFRFAHGKTLR
jgi:hypothetical protein